jgi:AraC-like DNA-binding protein
MEHHFLDFFYDSLRIQGIHFTFLNDNFDNIISFDKSLRKKLGALDAYNALKEQLLHCCNENTLYIFKDTFLNYYMMFRFPEKWAKKEGVRYGIIGPYLYTPITHTQFNEMVTSLQIPNNFHTDLHEFLNTVPVLPNYTTWQGYTSLFLEYLSEKGTLIEVIHMDQSLYFSSDFQDFATEENLPYSSSLIEERYGLEDAFISAIEDGNFNKASSAFALFLTHRIDSRVADPIRNRKNLTVVLNTLCRKAVQRASVHPAHIDEISTLFAKQIEAATSITELDSLSDKMLRKYCMIVNNFSLKGYSLLIQKVMNYIDFNYTEELSLKRLSEQFSVSNSYLSSLFKKEAGKTLTDYINEERIRHSLLLLNTTHMPIQTIASQVGFLDVNYFTRVFKKIHGDSPRAYRKKIQSPL